MWLCSTETHAIFSDFCQFQAGLMAFELIVIKRCVWGSLKSDANHSVTFEGDLHALPFENQMLKSVTLCSGQNCLAVLLPH